MDNSLVFFFRSHLDHQPLSLQPMPYRIELGQFQAARAIRNEHRWNIWRVNNDVGLKIKSFKISGTLIQFAYGEKFTLSLTLRLADTQLSCNAI